MKKPVKLGNKKLTDIEKLLQIDINKRYEHIIKHKENKHVKLFIDEVRKITLNDFISLEHECYKFLSCFHIAFFSAVPLIEGNIKKVATNPLTFFANNALLSINIDSIPIHNVEFKQYIDWMKDSLDGITDAVERHTAFTGVYGRVYKLIVSNFKSSIPKTVINTPVEAINFMTNMTNDALKIHFGVDINDESVKVIDPFAGWGSFISLPYATGAMKPRENAVDNIKLCDTFTLSSTDFQDLPEQMDIELYNVWLNRIYTEHCISKNRQ